MSSQKQIPTFILETFTCALYDNQTSAARRCLEEYPQLVQQRIFYDQNPFDFVTLTGRLEMAQLLLEFGANVNDTRGGRHLQSPLMNAVTDRNMKMVHLLLQHNAEVDAPNSEGRTPLFKAVSWNNPEIIRLFVLQHGADANHHDWIFGYTPLMSAVAKKCVHAVRALLECPTIDINAQSNTGTTALYLCCLNDPSGWRPEPKYLAIKRLLLGHSSIQLDHIGTNSVSPPSTALEHSVREGYIEYVKLLLSRGANPFRFEGESAFQIACQQGAISMIYEIVRSFPYICLRQK